MYDTDGSSVASSSYEDQDEMERFINRCSICFDAQLDLCLEYCKDQYCIECFQKYITEVVMSSWGLSVTPIRCPVCTELIPKHEWSQYVPRKITEMYETFNKPYRSYTRACPHCETDMVPCIYNNNIQSNTRLFCDMMEKMLHSCTEGESHKNHRDHIAIKRWIPVYKRQDLSDSMLPNLYKNIMADVIYFERNHLNQRDFAYNISLQFLNLYVKPEVWKQIQFAHISLFPNMNCSQCKLSICLQCGYDSHENLICEDNMKKMISNKLINKDIKDTVKWKLKNSRRCPNCSIMINRDEGCNKVDCSYCGFCFCWACKSSWADGCGFYRCSNNDMTDEAYDNTEIHVEEKTEIGVPNMKNIQARLVNHLHREQ